MTFISKYLKLSAAAALSCLTVSAHAGDTCTATWKSWYACTETNDAGNQVRGTGATYATYQLRVKIWECPTSQLTGCRLFWDTYNHAGVIPRVLKTDWHRGTPGKYYYTSVYAVDGSRKAHSSGLKLQ